MALPRNVTLASAVRGRQYLPQKSGRLAFHDEGHLSDSGTALLRPTFERSEAITLTELSVFKKYGAASTTRTRLFSNFRTIIVARKPVSRGSRMLKKWWSCPSTHRLPRVTAVAIRQSHQTAHLRTRVDNCCSAARSRNRSRDTPTVRDRLKWPYSIK